MPSNRLHTELLISAGVDGLNHIDLVIDALRAAGHDTEQLAEEAARLREEWDSLSPEQQAERMRNLGDATNNASEDARRLAEETERNTSAFERMKGAVVALGAALGVAFVAGKIKAFFTDAVSGAADFEQQLSTVKAVSGASAEEMERLRVAAEKMGAETQYNATEAAQGLENLARAGLTANESIEALPAVLALAQGNSIGLAEAASYITQAASGMGLAMSEAGRVADVLSKAAANANTNINDMGQALSYAAPVAASLGLTIEETAAYIGKFADAGIQGSRAGTALNNMMAQFANPASTFEREMAAIGIRTSDFNQAIRELAAAGPKGQAAINALGMEAGPAFKALLGQGIGALDELTEKLENASGYATGLASVMDDNLHGAFAGLESAWENLKNKLSEPILEPLAATMRELGAVIGNLVDTGKIDALGQKIAEVFRNGADAVILFVRELDFSALMDKITAGFQTLTTVGSALIVTLHAVGVAFNTVKAAVAGIAWALTYLVETAVQAGHSIAKVGTTVTDFFGITKNATDGVLESMDAVTHAARETRHELENMVRNAREGMVSGLKGMVGTAETTARETGAALAKIPADAEAAAAKAVHPMLALYQSMSDKVREVTGVAQRETEKQANAAQEAARKTQEAQEQAALAAKDAFAGIGVDLDEVFTGISSKTRKAMSDYTYAVEQAMVSGQDATLAARAGFEALAGQIESPQAWAAFKQHLDSTGTSLEHLTQNQLKRMDDAIKGLPDTAATAMSAMKSSIESADVGSFARIRAEAQSAFQAGELSAAQYAEVLRDLNDKTEQLRSKTQDTGTSAAQAHDKAAAAAHREKDAKQDSADADKAATAAKKEHASATVALYDATNLTADALAVLSDKTGEWQRSVTHALLNGLAGYNDHAIRLQQEMRDYTDAVRAAQVATDDLSTKTSAGTVSLHDIAEAAQAARGHMWGLDQTTLANLNAAIDAARQKLADMKQEAEDTRASLEAQLASLQGDDSKAQALDEERRLRELNLKLQEAEAKGQRAVADEYRRSIELQKQVFAEERRQQQQRQNEDTRRREESAKHQSNSTGNSTTSRSNTAGISATEVADAWDARIADAEKRGAENFSRELYNQAKRHAR